MDIENIRYLLTALIQTLPMVYSITIIAFFAIPRSQKKTVVEFLRKTATYLFILTAFTGGTVFATIWVLANLSYFFCNAIVTIYVIILFSGALIFILVLYIALMLVKYLEFNLKKYFK